MDTLRLVGQAAWQVLMFGLLLGAGLPALFAFGVRSVTPAAAGPDGAAPAPPGIASRVTGYACFAIVLAAVLVGILIIVAAGLGQVVSFDQGYPTLVPKE